VPIRNAVLPGSDDEPELELDFGLLVQA